MEIPMNCQMVWIHRLAKPPLSPQAQPECRPISPRESRQETQEQSPPVQSSIGYWSVPGEGTLSLRRQRRAWGKSVRPSATQRTNLRARKRWPGTFRPRPTTSMAEDADGVPDLFSRIRKCLGAPCQGAPSFGRA